MAGYPQVQRLKPEKEEPCIERAEDRTGISHEREPDLEDKGNIPKAGEVPEGIPVFQAVVARIRFGELGEFAVIPGKFSGIDNDTANRVPVAADILGGRVDDDIRTMLDRADESDTGRIIHDKGDPGIMGNLCNGLKVRDIQFRVADGLCIHCPGLCRDRLSECFRFCRVHEDDMPAELREGVVEELVRAAIQVVSRDDLITGPGDVQDRVGDGCRLRMRLQWRRSRLRLLPSASRIRP